MLSPSIPSEVSLGVLLLLYALLGTAMAGPSGDPARGTTVYMANCMACHGKDGAGDGPAARALRPPPRSFATEAFWEDMTPERMRAAIRTGAPGTAMMGFPGLTEQDLLDLVAFMETKRPK